MPGESAIRDPATRMRSIQLDSVWNPATRMHPVEFGEGVEAKRAGDAPTSDSPERSLP